MPIQTRAAVLRNYDSPLTVEAITLDDPEPGEVVVRLAACGVCHSDLHMISPVFKEALPAVLGHEGAGIVERVGPQVTSVAPGDHVVLTWIPSCGRCRYCASGRPALCNNRQGVERRDGATRLRLHDAQGEGCINCSMRAHSPSMRWCARRASSPLMPIFPWRSRRWSAVAC